MSPTVLRVRGYRFYFFSREEARPHVHVQHVTGEAKIWLDPRIELAHNYGLTEVRTAVAVRLAEEPRMRSARRGKRTSKVEVTNVTARGFWLLLAGRELFVPFADFPWFRDASIGQILAVEQPSADHLCWPQLDVDLAVESIEHPERYPLVSRPPTVIGAKTADPHAVRERGPAYRRPRRGRSA
jgi:hypothetical protein